VDFELSDDQKALQLAAADVLGSLATSERVRAASASGEPFDDLLWKAMVEQGWLGVELPEDRGGLGLGAVESAVLLEQVGRVNAPAPLLSALVALSALARAGDAGVPEAGDWVDRVVAGDAIACATWDAAAPAPYAPCADLVVAPVSGELVVVALGDRRPARESAMDLTRPLGWLDIGGLPAVRLGGDDALDVFLDHGATLYAAEMLGGAARAMELSVEYAKERVQFGRPIGSFQAVKHRCADMLVDVEGMRSSVYWAAWCISAGHPDASVAASTAKSWCSDASKRVMASTLQVHGGIGFTWEHDTHLFLKRAQLDQSSFGDGAFHRDRLVALLRARVEAGESLL
jgi:alkylation response protein AidB-like acyl-CoA dehydrogenase